MHKQGSGRQVVSIYPLGNRIWFELFVQHIFSSLHIYCGLRHQQFGTYLQFGSGTTVYIFPP